jgi:hypothetical protein
MADKKGHHRFVALAVVRWQNSLSNVKGGRMKSQSFCRGDIPLFLLVALACLGGPARTQPAPTEPSTAEARIDIAAAALVKNPRYRREATEFIVGNMLFVMLHELAHTATSQMKIPVLGRREDAADMFAVTRLIKQDNAFTDDVLNEGERVVFVRSPRQSNGRHGSLLRRAWP